MLASLVLCNQPALAQPAANQASNSSSVQPYPLPLDAKHSKKSPDDVQMFSLDNQPIGNRAPLLMIHGLRGEFWQGLRWSQVCDYLTADAEFNKRFKIYLARYNTYQAISKSVAQFKQPVKDLWSNSNQKPLTILTLSIGGNICCELMTDPEVEKTVGRVIAMGTMFHGSPLFSTPWMEYSMFHWHKSPFSKFDSCFPYRIYFNHHRNLATELHWDDSDRQIPQIGEFKTKFPFYNQGEISPKASGNPTVLAFNSNKNLDKSKFVVYGTYLDTDFSAGQKRNPLGVMLRSPAWFATTIVPEHMGKEHAVLRCLNLQMAHLVNTDKKAGLNDITYGLNDGITPLSSALFMSNDAIAKNPLSFEKDVANVKPLLDVGKARIFKNADHVTFVDDYHPHGAPRLMQDELAPQEGRKPIFNWIMGDILNSPHQQLAEDLSQTKP